MIEYEVSRKDVARAMKALTKLENGGPKNVKNAVNRTATKVRRKMVGQMKSAYRFKEGFSVKTLDLFRASPGNLVAEIVSKGPTRQTKEFAYGEGGQGVSATVRSGSGGLIRGSDEAGGAFIATGGKVAGMICQRVGAARMPIEVKHSNSIPMMAEKSYTGENGGADMEPEALKILFDEINKEIAKLVNSA